MAAHRLGASPAPCEPYGGPGFSAACLSLQWLLAYATWFMQLPQLEPTGLHWNAAPAHDARPPDADRLRDPPPWRQPSMHGLSEDRGQHSLYGGHALQQLASESTVPMTPPMMPAVLGRTAFAWAEYGLLMAPLLVPLLRACRGASRLP